LRLLDHCLLRVFARGLRRSLGSNFFTARPKSIASFGRRAGSARASKRGGSFSERSRTTSTSCSYLTRPSETRNERSFEGSSVLFLRSTGAVPSSALRSSFALRSWSEAPLTALWRYRTHTNPGVCSTRSRRPWMWTFPVRRSSGSRRRT